MKLNIILQDPIQTIALIDEYYTAMRKCGFHPSWFSFSQTRIWRVLANRMDQDTRLIFKHTWIDRVIKSWNQRAHTFSRADVATREFLKFLGISEDEYQIYLEDKHGKDMGNKDRSIHMPSVRRHQVGTSSPDDVQGSDI